MQLQKLVITQAKLTEERKWLSEVSNIPLQQSVADLDIALKKKSHPVKESGKVAKLDIPNSRKEQTVNRHVLGWEDFPLKAMEYISLKLE